MSYYSRYFEKALNGQFKEAKLLVIDLPTEEPKTFERFVGWLYTRKLDLPTQAKAHEYFQAICEAWAFADRREIPLLANVLIDAMRDGVVDIWKIPTSVIGYIYDNTTAHSGMRRLTVRLISSMGGPSTMESKGLETQWPKEAVWDVLRAVWELKSAGQATLMGKDEAKKLRLCEYHDHEQGVACSQA